MFFKRANPYILGIFEFEIHIRRLFIEIHDKLGLILIVFSIIHIIKKWNPTIKVISMIIKKTLSKNI